MRLLRMNEDGDVSLEDHPEKTEPYAILSHRWGEDHEEVNFKDVIEHTYKHKRGYAKILGCGEQAKWDNHQLFWIDTCCIDKSSSAELSESINSMWRWYCNSQVCYVYLDDVRADIDEAEKHTAFTKSKWFTRGWTLQELLAPPKLEFYDAEWNKIGTKEELAEKISEITNINKDFLGSDISLLKQASIAERMSWASKRRTKRKEDRAYSLLGIFDINMPLLYGEGAKAFQRLQEEIVKHSDDQSILAWTSPSAEIDSGSFFAHSPAAFAACDNVIRSIQPGPMKPYFITNKGLKISLPLIREGSEGELLAVLNCRRRYDTFGSLALPVKQTGNNHLYQRRGGELQFIPFTDLLLAKVQPMYISMKPLLDYSPNYLKDNTCILSALPKGLEVSQIFPSGSWPRGSRTFEGNRHPGSPQDPVNRTLVLLSSGTTRRYLFMTFFHKNRIFRDCIWDARILPVSLDDSSDIEQIFNAWIYKDLSTLQRVHHLSCGRVALRTVPQLIQGRKVTMIEIFCHDPDTWIVLYEITEQAIAVLQSTGYRITRVPYWTFHLLFGGSNLLDAMYEPTPMLLAYLTSSSPRENHVQRQSITLRWYHFLALLYYVLLRWSKLRKVQQLSLEEGVVLGWQNVRNFDAIIGYCAILLLFVFVPLSLLDRYFAYTFDSMGYVIGVLSTPALLRAIHQLYILR